MIIKHKIIYENNEEILCVYLDANLEEFASEMNDSNGEKSKNLREQITEYIKNKNIAFNGKVVKILAGSMVVASLFLAPGAIDKVSAATTTTTTSNYVVEPGDSLWGIGNQYGISIDEIKQINNLTGDTIFPGQTLKVSTTVSTPQVESTSTFYQVKYGDSLSVISSRTNVSINNLKSYNGLSGDLIHPGQTLILIPNAEVGTYNVQSGDSLWTIANKYGMTVNDLKTLNNTGDMIFPGQRLKVIQQVQTTPQETGIKTYTVQSGDSLYWIARNHNMTITELQSLNNLSTSTIYPGQTLKVTGVATAQTPAPLPGETAPNLTRYDNVNVRRTSGVVESIAMEDYVIGVVASELGPGFHEEAYKAQALAARTYAIKTMEQGKTLTDTASHQVYKDPAQLRQAWGTNFDRDYQIVKSAVAATSGEVITYNGDYIEAYFFSTSNGKTENPSFIWGGNVPYLKSVDSSWDTASPYYFKSTTFTNAEFASRLGISSSNLYATVTSYTDGGGVNTINISGRSFSGEFVRSRLGLRSTDYTLSFGEGVVTIEQKGWGHRVGLSQYGAHYMGQKGYTYNQIIKHYYQGVDIVRV